MTNVRTHHATGQTVRYHTNPVMSRLHQTDADHTWGVCMIIVSLHPNPSRNLLGQAIVHDCGEKWAGDLSYPFKRRYVNLATMHANAETELSLAHGIPQFNLTAEEVDWLRFADRLECHLFAEIYHPWMTKDPSWELTKKQILQTAQRLGITQDIFAAQNNMFT